MELTIRQQPLLDIVAYRSTSMARQQVSRQLTLNIQTVGSTCRDDV
ncbi:MAG: hypothetical protein IKI06_07360 [Prevotella sp.]|nr:hypothetical protein [Prevotella sp.]